MALNVKESFEETLTVAKASHLYINFTLLYNLTHYMRRKLLISFKKENHGR